MRVRFFGNIFSGIEKVVNTFSILKKIFPKMINYCALLGHTLVKSILMNVKEYLMMSSSTFLTGISFCFNEKLTHHLLTK